jgi:zinc protease
MMRRLIALSSAILLSACAAHPAHVASAPKPDWAFQQSDLPPDPAFRFGKLANGMRYVIRRNATPPGTAQVRLDIATGSLDERDDERGFAHFVEHMAFNGSTHVPEGEMVKLLERDGLAFGADTNASTSFEQTLYQLDLPRADPALLDTALMLMRETASDLTFDPAAVARERGVVLSELRDGQGYALDNLKDQIAFLYPKAVYPRRLPIGTPETLNAATAEALRAFWARGYVPEKATLIVVGDFAPDAVEQAIRTRFESWQPSAETPRPPQGKVQHSRKDRADVWIAQALSERITVSRHGPWVDEPDTVAQRRRNLLRQIGYDAVNRRFLRMSRAVAPPFRGAGYGTSDVFRIGRTTNLIVDVEDKGWRAGLMAATRALRQALTEGFTPEELAEQVANLRTNVENAAASADTRSNGALVQAALALVRDDMVPTTPESALARFNAFAPSITPDAVLAALKADAVPLNAPLLRFQGRSPPAGGARAIRAAWEEAVRPGASVPYVPVKGPFAYTAFGAPGAVVSDVREPLYGIRQVRFANGVRLNLKHTDLERDRIAVRLSVDGGELLATRADPLAVEMASSLPAGGLGKHSQDDLQTLLAGRSVANAFGASGEVFSSAATTTRRDLELQLQLLAATLSDPGYRAEAEVRFRANMTNFFARANATPQAALSNALGGIVSGDDPRFTVQAPEDYQRLSFERLRSVIDDRLARGAVEIGMAGDLDEDAAIAMTARTFGALPPREGDFRAYAAERERTFTTRRGLTVVRHKGAANQAVVRLIWPTTDDTDPATAAALDLLQEVVAIEVLDSVREQLGKAYSPGATSAQSRTWRGWGTFAVQASVDVADVAATRAAFARTLNDLAAKPVDADVLQRARAPMREQIDALLKSNSGWLALADRAQSHPDRLARAASARARLDAVTAQDVQEVARRYLSAHPVEVLVLPEGAPAPER